MSNKTPSMAPLPSYQMFALDNWQKVPDLQSRKVMPSKKDGIELFAINLSYYYIFDNLQLL